MHSQSSIWPVLDLAPLPAANLSRADIYPTQQCLGPLSLLSHTRAEPFNSPVCER
jgi:hypothetical protein